MIKAILTFTVGVLVFLAFLAAMSAVIVMGGV